MNHNSFGTSQLKRMEFVYIAGVENESKGISDKSRTVPSMTIDKDEIAEEIEEKQKEMLNDNDMKTKYLDSFSDSIRSMYTSGQRQRSKSGFNTR